MSTLVFGQDPTSKKQAAKANDDPLRQKRDAMQFGPRATTCCLCKAPLPTGHQYLCVACGLKGYAQADDQLHLERHQRRFRGEPEHGGGRWLTTADAPTPSYQTDDDGSVPSTIASAWRHGVPMSSIERS
jgi:hypothetical protein